MVSINKLLLLLFFPASLWADSLLPLLFTKQPIRNVRFLSHDGVLTYFQNSSGELLLSTNYQASEVLKGIPGSNFLMISSKARKYILLTIDEHYHNFYGIREPLNIYKLRFGKSIPEKIGLGQSPRLHLNDTWATFYNFQKKQVSFQNLIIKALKFTITINNEINPFFNPHVAMINKEIILFTDLNEKGFPGILLFNRGENKSKAIYKGSSVNEKVEFCLQNEHLIVGIFGLENSKKGSEIFRYPIKGLTFDKRNVLYKSNKNDLGNMVCNFAKDSIYFVKNLSENLKSKYEAVKFNLSSKKIKIISDVGYANQIVPMDDKLLLPFRGKVYVLEGRSNYTSDGLGEKEKPKK
ncbi:MAG: hypothetical protein DRQ88_07135 [Epsilonproteobacteria bacterium]|nr:MAG: hypothetical protein DRQ89_03280 [Campylobacterota bacterium]RLA66256.1 MAG: hypothetical protein DRQ88_07135 [Campylobacterota bacterium]